MNLRQRITLSILIVIVCLSIWGNDLKRALAVTYYSWRYRVHATDCTALTDGKDQDLCYEQDADVLYKCDPSAGDCDTPAEWKNVTTPSIPTLQSVFDSGQSVTIADGDDQTWKIINNDTTNDPQTLWIDDNTGEQKALRITDGNETNNYVWTSDANGYGTWEAGFSLSAGDVTQSILSTAVEEESFSDSGDLTFATADDYGFMVNHKYDTTNHPGTSYDMQIGKTINHTSYLLRMYVTENGAAGTGYAQVRYITASDNTPWLWALRDKNTGKIYRASYAEDHPQNNALDIVSPFSESWESPDREIILIDEESAKDILKKVTSDRSFLTVFHEEYEIDMDSNPEFKPRVLRELDEWGDKEGQVIKKIKTPNWAKIVISRDELEIKQKIHTTLPGKFKYKKLKKK